MISASIHPDLFTYDHSRTDRRAHEANFFDFFKVCSHAVNLHHFRWSELWPREGTITEPPFDLWANILPTATILQFLRWEIQAPILITSGYRDLDHNRAVGGVENSTHTTFQALDFKSPGASPDQIRRVLLSWRGRWFPLPWGLSLSHLPTQPARFARGNGSSVQFFQFIGGIGTYPTFTHLDTRGHYATWKGN